MSPASVKLLRWALFGVVISTIPIVYAAGNLFILGVDIRPTELLGNGDLLMATCASCAVAVGEVVGTRQTALEGKIISGFLAFLIVIASCLAFAAITQMRSLKTLNDAALVHAAILSASIFGCGVVFGGFTVWFSEG